MRRPKPWDTHRGGGPAKTLKLPGMPILLCLVGLALAWMTATSGAGNPGPSRPELDPTTPPGYLARLLINETPFPGERSWVSEDDTKAAMRAILGVLDSRLRRIPEGYRQEEIAASRCRDIIDVMTAGGEKGQCDGFYRDASGNFKAVARVNERVDYLVLCASRGKPGRFSRLLDYAGGLASSYMAGGLPEADVFAKLERVGDVPVTGHAYSWMTDRQCYDPGGNFVRIPDGLGGSHGGNRFFTLRRKK